MKIARSCILTLFFALYINSQTQIWAESRPGTIDAVLLVDKSLSMVDSLAKVKRFAAGDVIGALLVPGDRLIIEVFYGKVERLFAGTLRSEADKAEAVRSLNGIVADGPFTDIGAALDRAGADLAELGSPERPKYVLLLTDERQEAPAGSPYVAKDYKLVHPALTYIRRLDLGLFRAITVGLDVAAKVDKAAPSIMNLLLEPPERVDKDFPPLAQDSSPGLETAAAGVGDERQQAAPKTGSKPGKSDQGPGGGRPDGLPLLPTAFFGALVLAAVLIAAIVLSVKRKKREKERHDS